MNNRFRSLVMALAAMFASTAGAQSLLLQVDRETALMTLTGAGASGVNLGGYRIGSTNGSISVADFNGIRDEVSDWVLAGAQSANGVQELLSDAFGTTPINDAVTYVGSPGTELEFAL